MATRKKRRRSANRFGFRPRYDGEDRHRQVGGDQIARMPGIVLADTRIIRRRHIDTPAAARSELCALLRFLSIPTAVLGAAPVVGICFVLLGRRGRHRAAGESGQLEAPRSIRVRAEQAGPKETACGKLESQQEHRDVGCHRCHLQKDSQDCHEEPAEAW